MQQLNRETNSKMATFSFFSLLFCLLVADLQLWHLKAFFEGKKLLQFCLKRFAIMWRGSFCLNQDEIVRWFQNKNDMLKLNRVCTHRPFYFFFFIAFAICHSSLISFELEQTRILTMRQLPSHGGSQHNINSQLFREKSKKIT